MNCAIHTDIPATAYCRTCGKALCENCKRDVMGAIYCEPCIAARLQGAGPAVPRAVPVTIVEGAPSPALAGVLAALIPGLGAMYNGQFIKAFLHVVIFAMLIVAVSHSFGFAPLFGILIGFFWFYMIFDAVKSARAKQLGLPAPDPLGLDRLFGIEESQPATPRTVADPAGTTGQVSPQPAVTMPALVGRPAVSAPAEAGPPEVEEPAQPCSRTAHNAAMTAYFTAKSPQPLIGVP